jgi:mannosyltransferase OCH1-like enzyme
VYYNRPRRSSTSAGFSFARLDSALAVAVSAHMTLHSSWNKTTDRVVFTFWEPRNKIIPYLKLCQKTWEKNLPDYEIIVLDYSNIDNYLPRGTYDIAFLRQLTLSMQKDAVSVAVLKEYGGVFMDIDTLVLRDLFPIVCRLENTEVVMFGTHLAFLAARPNSYVLAQWVERIQEKLAKVASENSPMVEIPWDYVGNRTLSAVMDEIINSSSFNRMQTKAVDKFTQLATSQPSSGPGFKKILNRLHDSFLARRRRFFFGTVYRKYLSMLDRKKHGYILEAKHYEAKYTNSEAKRLSPEDKYLEFWFENSVGVDTVIQMNPIIVGLHNSWTPQWYKELSEKDVQASDCLLSRTISYILAS